MSRVRSVKHRHFIGFMMIVSTAIIGSKTSLPWQRCEVLPVAAHDFTFLLNGPCTILFFIWGANIASCVNLENSFG